MFSVESNTIACPFLGKVSLSVASANDFIFECIDMSVWIQKKICIWHTLYKFINIIVIDKVIFGFIIICYTCRLGVLSKSCERIHIINYVICCSSGVVIKCIIGHTNIFIFC